MINFKLRDLDKIAPWGQEPELSLHWFGLTDGDLWLNFGNETIYEYSKEMMDHWGNKPTPYIDYPISRFIEDFTELFDTIRETISGELYDITKDLKKFKSDTKRWLDINDTDEANSDFYFDEYQKLNSWIYERKLDSGHLIGGPHLYFFRYNNRVRIVWDTEHALNNGVNMWLAKNGSFEMGYSDFVEKIKTFGDSFFTEMGLQVELAVAKDWGQVKIDKKRLIEEHQERKNDFYSSLVLIDQQPVDKTDWAYIEQLLKRVKGEI